MIEATERKDIINEIYPFHINFRLSSIYYGVILRSLILFIMLVHSVYSPGTFVGAKHLYILLSHRLYRTSKHSSLPAIWLHIQKQMAYSDALTGVERGGEGGSSAG